MGQQLNKVIKRRRRKAYLARKKARTKAGIANNSSGRVKRPGAVTASADGVKAAKKVAAKKAPAAKKAAKPKKEDAPVVDAAPAEEAAPAAEA